MTCMCQAGSIFGDHGEDLRCANALNMQATLLATLENRDKREDEVDLHKSVIDLCKRQPQDCPHAKEFYDIQADSAL